jgi:hypothetical protein
MAIVLGVIAAAGAIFGAVEAKKQSAAQQRQNQIKNRIAATQRARSIRQTVARNRIKRAELESSGFKFGVAGGSQVQGATGAAQSDTAGAIGASNQQFTGQQVVSSIQDDISRMNSNIAVAGAVSSIAGGLAGNAQFTTASDKFFGFTG